MEIENNRVSVPEIYHDAQVQDEGRKNKVVNINSAPSYQENYRSNDELFRQLRTVNRSSKKNRKTESLSSVGRAYELIGKVIYEDVTLVERSNLFDEWKEHLLEISYRSKEADINFRQILGFVLSAVNKKDVIDFKKEEILIFQESTNILRSINPKKIDVEKIYRLLDNHNLIEVNQFFTGDEERIKDLDDYIDILSKGAF